MRIICVRICVHELTSMQPRMHAVGEWQRRRFPLRGIYDRGTVWAFDRWERASPALMNSTVTRITCLLCAASPREERNMIAVRVRDSCAHPSCWSTYVMPAITPNVIAEMDKCHIADTQSRRYKLEKRFTRSGEIRNYRKTILCSVQRRYYIEILRLVFCNRSYFYTSKLF